MCDRKDCYFISIIDIGDEEKVFIHYSRDLESVIMIQHYHPKTDYLGEYHKK
jgi:hypothetical protein